MVRDALGVIIAVEDTVGDVLGWRPEDLVGHPSTEFIHPQDQPSAVAAWFAMRGTPGAGSVWVGRYRTRGGIWKWVQAVNTNHLDDPVRPAISSTLTLVSGERVSLEEELQARQQMLSRLSDALPVGVFQSDADGRVTFTNDRLKSILGPVSAATVTAQFLHVVDEDRALVDVALATALEDLRVPDLEIRLIPTSTDPASAGGDGRVCVLSLRTLTDSSGAVTGVIGCVADVTDGVRLRRQLELKATFDELTSCLNRASTLELLTTTLTREADSARGIAVAFIDLDRFKPVNDSYGHAAGDRLLEVAAHRLRSAVRDGDRVGRVGGDEFLVICPGVEGPAEAFEIGERLAEALRATIDVGSGLVDLRASVGVAWTADPLDADTLVAQADEAMYQAKRAGQSAVALHGSAGVELAARRELQQRAG